MSYLLNVPKKNLVSECIFIFPFFYFMEIFVGLAAKRYICAYEQNLFYP